MGAQKSQDTIRKLNAQNTYLIAKANSFFSHFYIESIVWEVGFTWDLNIPFAREWHIKCVN